MQILTLAHVHCKTIVWEKWNIKEGLSGHSICTTIDMYFTGGAGVICGCKIVADNPPKQTAVDKNFSWAENKA
jgi:hypothetical protein